MKKKSLEEGFGKRMGIKGGNNLEKRKVTG